MIEDNRELEAKHFADDLTEVLERHKSFLIEKNTNYGDSCLTPVRAASKAPADEQIKVRIDDKISRLIRGRDAGEDTLQDLWGYLTILMVSKHRQERIVQHG